MKLLAKSNLIGIAILLVLGIGIGLSLNDRTSAQGAKPADSARYSVVETDGMSLIVTDRQNNTVYFYTVDENEKPGADLHLRGTLDLTKVGDATIKAKLINPKKP